MNSKLNTEMIIFLPPNRCHDRLIREEIPTARHIELHELFSQSSYTYRKYIQGSYYEGHYIARLTESKMSAHAGVPNIKFVRGQPSFSQSVGPRDK